MERAMLLIFIVAVIGAGVIAGGAGLLTGSLLAPQEQAYTTLDGPCQIRVYDDPLYAEHWAKNVNNYNCNSYEVQENAQNIEAQTRQVDWETEQAKIGVFSIFFVVCSVLGLLVVAVVRG